MTVKNLLRTLLLVGMTVLLAGCGESVSNSTPEEFAQSMFHALQENDVRAFLQLCADKNDYIAYIRPAAPSEEKLRREMDRAERKYGDSAKLAEDRTDRFREAVSEIDWKEARLGRIVSESTTDGLGRVDFNMMLVEIEYQDRTLLLAIDEVVQTPGGFKSIEDRGVLELR